MPANQLFEQFENGSLSTAGKVKKFAAVPWSAHPAFAGVALKHLVVADDTDGLFSYHLVRIDPDCEIGNHTHAAQLETHEVIAGKGAADNDGVRIAYHPGVVSIFAKNTPHKVTAEKEGLLLFAKFIPPLC
jgi:Uncharacterized conserved protein, contains double-stranded beta-helix domain